MLAAIDFSAPADLYPGRRRIGKSPLRYMRFDTVAEAIRYAIEVSPPAHLDGMLIESDEQRYDGEAIGALYRSAGYPLPRAVVAA